MMKKNATPLHGTTGSVSNVPSALKTSNPAAVPGRVSCTICQHEIPLSEAVVPEALDYVIYFCGLDCYDRWRAEANS